MSGAAASKRSLAWVVADAAWETLFLLAAWPFRAEGEVPAEPRRILVVAYSAIGDLIFFMPALEALRTRWPKARITYVADPYPGTEEVLPAAGLADEYWKYHYRDLLWDRTKRGELCRRIREGGFDVAVVGQGTPLRGLGPALLTIPVRVGQCRPIQGPAGIWSALRYRLWQLHRGFARQEFERRLAFNRQIWVGVDDEHTVGRNLRLAQALGISTPAPEAARPRLVIPEGPRAFAAREVPDAPGKRTLGLHIGAPASAYAKIWPPEKWAEAFRAIAARAPCRVVLLGGPDERETAGAFAAAYGGEVIDLVGRSKLLESFACIRRCELLLSNDTGLSKAAMALGVPTVAVWGPSDRPGYGIVWDRPLHAEVYRLMPCSPCVRMGLPQEGAGVLNFDNCGHRDCLNKLEPSSVVDAALRRLGVA